MGRCQFSIEDYQIDYIGYLNFSYKQTATSPSVFKRFSFGSTFSQLDKETIDDIKKEVEKEFTPLFQQLKEMFVSPREIHMPRPRVMNVQFQETKSSDSLWVFTFSLKEYPTSKLSISMELEGNTWYYTFQSSNDSLVPYKTFLQWEDYLVEDISNHIKLMPQLRYKFLYQKVHFKFRKKYK